MRNLIATYINNLASIPANHLALISIVVVVSWAIIIDTNPTSDASAYHNSAIEISQGHGYDPDVYFPVGYPMFLGTLYALFGPNLLVARIANALMYLGIIAATYYLTKEWFHSRQQATLAAFLLIFCAGFLVYITLTMSEILYTLLMLAGIILIHLAANPKADRYKLGLLFLSGIIFGFSALVRSQGLFVPLAILVSMGYTKRISLSRIFLAIVVLHIGVALVVGPWIAHLYNIYGQFVLISTNGGVNLFMGNNPNADGSYDFEPEEAERIVSDFGYDLTVAASAAERDAIFRSVAVDYIQANPINFISLMPFKLFYYFRDEVLGWVQIESTPLRLTGMALAQGIYIINSFLFIYGLYLYRKQLLSSQALVAIFIMLVFLFITVIFLGSSRYRMPTVPLTLMFSSYTLLHFSRLSLLPKTASSEVNP